MHIKTKKINFADFMANLTPFLENNSATYSVKDYAQKTQVNRNTASRILYSLYQENFLHLDQRRQGTKEHQFYANPTEKFRTLNNLFWKDVIRETGLVDYLQKTNPNCWYVVTGAFAQGTMDNQSSLDIVIGPHFSLMDVSHYEAKLLHPITIRPDLSGKILEEDYFYKL